MYKRAITGFIFVSLLIFSIQFNAYTFLGLFYLLMLISNYEMAKMLQIKTMWIYPLSTLVFAASNKNVPPKITAILQGVIVLIIAYLFIKELFSKNSDSIKKLGGIFLTIIYTCVPYIFITKIPYVTKTYESNLILGVFILIWSSDTFAYLVGKSIGKHKLLERISPKKTIEGFVGGIIATIGFSYLLSCYFTTITPFQWMVTAFIVSFFGVLGDLIASMFKRQTGVKDTGKIIPGHGGVIDRLDSIIFAAPIVYIYLKITLAYVS